jgi:hypothetical protein
MIVSTGNHSIIILTIRPLINKKNRILTEFYNDFFVIEQSIYALIIMYILGPSEHKKILRYPNFQYFDCCLITA